MEVPVYDVLCPSCFQPTPVAVDPSAGARQSFVIDCAVCCRPMTVRAELDAAGEVIDLTADFDQ